MRGREAFQELDYPAVFGSMTKWTDEIDDAERVPEFVARAFHMASSGRPGPVVLSLPRDMLTETVAARACAPCDPVESSPGEAEMARLAEMLAEAERPFFLLGGSRWSEAARRLMHDIAERLGVPVGTSYRRAPLFDALHANYAGDVGAGGRIRS